MSKPLMCLEKHPEQGQTLTDVHPLVVLPPNCNVEMAASLKKQGSSRQQVDDHQSRSNATVVCLERQPERVPYLTAIARGFAC